MGGGRRQAIEAHGLRKAYGDIIALASLDLAVDAGAVVGFLGPNGAGKTTAVRILSTILAPDAGTFTVDGVPHTSPAAIRSRIGVLPESAGYPAGETGEEYLRYHAQLYGLSRSTARSRASGLLGDVGLSERSGSLISGYSRGMRQRLGIARALVNDPAVLFLDEPTLGLDPRGQAEMLSLVTRLAAERGVTVLLSTHWLDEVQQACDRVVILHRGRLVADGTVAEIVARAGVPERAVVTVPADQVRRAVELLAEVGFSAEGSERPGEVLLSLPRAGANGRSASSALSRLLAGDVTVTGLQVANASLSDAFLSLTGEPT